MGGRKRGSRMRGDGESSVSTGMEGAASEENNLGSSVASQGTIFHRAQGCEHDKAHREHERLVGT